MGIHFQFEAPHDSICYVVFEPAWTWDDFDAQIDAITAQIRSRRKPVATLMDMTRIGPMPTGNVLAHLQRASSLMPANVDINVFVNAPYALINFVAILMRIRPRLHETTFFAHSLDEGYLIVAERRKHKASLAS